MLSKWLKKKIPGKKWDKYQDEFILSHSLLESVDYLNRSEKSIKIRRWRLNNRIKPLVV